MDAIRELQAIVQELQERIDKLEAEQKQLRADLETHENTKYGVHSL